MNRVEHLLSKVAEECAEIAQRAAKAQQFGLAEVQPGKDNPLGHNNAERLNHEFNDLIGVLELLREELDGWQIGNVYRNLVDDKKAKIEKYLLYAKECGTLQTTGAGHSVNAQGTNKLHTGRLAGIALRIFYDDSLPDDAAEVRDSNGKCLVRITGIHG